MVFDCQWTRNPGLASSRIVRRFGEVEHKESRSQVTGGSRDNRSLKNQREHLKVVEGGPVTEVLN
jgi:hypothetical protein